MRTLLVVLALLCVPARAFADEQRAYAIYRERAGLTDAKTLEHASNLAVIQSERGDYDEAIRIYREVLAILAQPDGADSAAALAVALNLAMALDFSGRTEESLVEFRRVVDGRRKIFGPAHPALADALVFSSLRLSRSGHGEEALAALDEARAIYLPLDHPELASVDNYTGLVLMDLGRFADAEKVQRRAIERMNRESGAKHVVTVTARSNLAAALLEQGRPKEALTILETAGADLRDLGEFDNPRVLRSRLAHGAALRTLGRYAESRAVTEAACAVAKAKLEPGHLRLADCEVELARLDLAEGAPGSAERARRRLEEADAIAAKSSPNPTLARNLARARNELAARGN